jgi:hypothetical protein
MCKWVIPIEPRLHGFVVKTNAVFRFFPYTNNTGMASFVVCIIVTVGQSSDALDNKLNTGRGIRHKDKIELFRIRLKEL